MDVCMHRWMEGQMEKWVDGYTEREIKAYKSKEYKTTSMFISDIGLQFSCGVFVWFWYQGHTGLIE